jgi:hypothetical protein
VQGPWKQTAGSLQRAPVHTTLVVAHEPQHFPSNNRSTQTATRNVTPYRGIAKRRAARSGPSITLPLVSAGASLPASAQHLPRDQPSQAEQGSPLAANTDDMQHTGPMGCGPASPAAACTAHTPAAIMLHSTPRHPTSQQTAVQQHQCGAPSICVTRAVLLKISNTVWDSWGGPSPPPTGRRLVPPASSGTAGAGTTEWRQAGRGFWSVAHTSQCSSVQAVRRTAPAALCPAALTPAACTTHGVAAWCVHSHTVCHDQSPLRWWHLVTPVPAHPVPQSTFGPPPAVSGSVGGILPAVVLLPGPCALCCTSGQH